MTTKNIGDMPADERFAEALRLEWDVDTALTGGKLREQFANSFENFAASRHKQRLLRVRCLRQTGVTAAEQERYKNEWSGSEALQEEFHDVEVYVSYHAAEE